MMNSISGFITFALAAVFVENSLLSGYVGTDLVLSSMRRLPRLAAVSLLVSVFALLNSLTVFPFDALMDIKWMSYMPVRGFLLTVSTLLWYLLIGGLMRKIRWIKRTAGQLIPIAALNGAVLSAPLLLGARGVDSFGAVFGTALGAGLGFFLASWLIGVGMRRFDNPDISQHMRGAPAMLIYIGLLALAFSAFGGAF